MDDKENLFEALDDIREAYQIAKVEYKRKADEWWEGLSYDDKSLAFYSVVNRILKADVECRGSYRYALYNVFGFEPDMYGIGMECGYMTIHNLIYDGLESKKSAKKEPLGDENGL
jgi:hypothetical protein